MADSPVTQVDRPYGQQPETRVAAVAHIVRDGHADILPALGLADVPAPPLGECPYCTTRLVALCVWHGEQATAPPAVTDEPLVIDGRHCCTNCRKPLPDPISNGGRKPCRRVACVVAAAEDAE